MKMHRLIQILLMLETDKKVTAKDLSEKLEVSIRTVYRDIEVLCEAGIPIYAETGPGGGISLMEGYQTRIKHLDKDDIIYLYLNGLGVKAERTSLLTQHTDLTLQKLAKDLPDLEREQLHNMVKRFVVDNSPWWGESQSLPNIDCIVQAVWQLHKLEITYEKVNLDTSRRTIRPYGIVIKDNKWYLVGYCENSKDIRIFKCERIKECSLLEQSFVYPMDFHLDEYFELLMKDFKKSCNLAEQYMVTFESSVDVFPWMRGIEYTVLEQDGNHYRICANFYTFDNAIKDYWNIFIQTKVLSPSELREAVQCKLEKAYRRYQE